MSLFKKNDSPGNDLIASLMARVIDLSAEVLDLKHRVSRLEKDDGEGEDGHWLETKQGRVRIE